MAQRRIYPPIYFFGSVLLMVALHYLAPVLRWLGGSWRYGGIALIALGAVVAFHVDRVFRSRATTIKPFGESTALVMDGVFAYSRNPIYLGMLIVLLGVAVLLGTLTPPFVLPVFAWILSTRFIRVEEQMLEHRFGSEYADYKGRVNRWLGRRAG